MLDCGLVITKVETEAWAVPIEGMSIWDLARRMNELGNIVMEIDETNGRIKVLHCVDEVNDGKSGGESRLTSNRRTCV